MKHKIGVDYLRSEHTNLTLSNTKWGTDLGMLVVRFDQSFHQLHTSQFISVLTTSPQCTFILQPRDLLVNKRDLLAKCLSGTYCHKTGTRPPSCQLLENRLYVSSRYDDRGVIKKVFFAYRLMWEPWSLKRLNITSWEHFYKFMKIQSWREKDRKQIFSSVIFRHYPSYKKLKMKNNGLCLPPP